MRVIGEVAFDEDGSVYISWYDLPADIRAGGLVGMRRQLRLAPAASPDGRFEHGIARARKAIEELLTDAVEFWEQAPAVEVQLELDETGSERVSTSEVDEDEDLEHERRKEAAITGTPVYVPTTASSAPPDVPVGDSGVSPGE